MTKPWEAEFIVDAELAVQLIESQFPEIAPVEVAKIGEGFDNTIYQVNGDYLFRFPRREIAVPLIETEGIILPRLSSDAPLDIPDPLFYGKPDHSYPWPFLGYKYVKGSVPTDLSKINGEESARLLGKMLKKIHHFPIEKAVELGVPYDRLYRVDIEKRKDKMKENMEVLMESGHWKWEEKWRTFTDSLTHIDYESPKALCHGDLHIRNILVDEKHTISGIIDWGDVHIGNPAVDLSIVYSFLPKDSRCFFFEEYGEVDDDLLQLARFKAVYTAAVLAVYGMDKKDSSLVSASIQSLKRSLD
ncbi:phosphotransferase [Falsibacillus pallidus]|uniref:Aminoglycoside phosphotransferase (APT) family kinase protein n=1 Tax=Falsibacillus pallidus TaxID=493781 RepID=A0A370GGN5_9BACI|nr:phosphotransferase [Falsibacillus pallidus]RDI42289.1 aminoglycoside phosphotransferase (APT) family kinase protein [Falsibacillus pallidus]